ncbi:hypothetical protein ZHAS_00020136 [Anopheles sinensis]|uniref:Uncharacterized protein n=1 Tax=Anopheles sinensis TaxID=74873 RepID=A0A084WP23_ANOSI|nr:hypothetical protein ZHAS_00020136 [Anopheles sinensis]
MCVPSTGSSRCCYCCGCKSCLRKASPAPGFCATGHVCTHVVACECIASTGEARGTAFVVASVPTVLSVERAISSRTLRLRTHNEPHPQVADTPISLTNPYSIAGFVALENCVLHFPPSHHPDLEFFVFSPEKNFHHRCTTFPGEFCVRWRNKYRTT